MKKFLRSFVIMQFILFGQVLARDFEHMLCAHNASHKNVYDVSMELCMEIWTELDLLGAIRTSAEDLMYFADTIIDRLLSLQRVLSLLKNFHDVEPFSYEDIENIKDLFRQIDDRFYDIFSEISSKEVICCVVLIERILTELEAFSFKSTSKYQCQPDHL